jgi:aminocarboxymuconate-semialdehyde decarboxylase
MADKVLRVDFHTHVFPRELPALAKRYGDERWPHLEPDGADAAQIVIGSTAYRRITDQAWSAAQRIEDMDREAVDIQVISPTPITFGYWGDPRGTAELSRYQNDFVARMVSEHPRRFIGLGTVALQDADSAIIEMVRARDELKLAGIEIGANVAGAGLHIPALRPFFKAAAELSCPLFIHPTNEPFSVPESFKRAALQGLYQTVGMPVETAVAAGTLIFGGVMTELPDLRICLAHGGGPLCWVAPRMGFFWEHTQSPAARLPVNPLEVVRSFWADTLTYDVGNLILLGTRIGTDKMMVGTDYPFDAREIPPGAVLDEAGKMGAFSAVEIDAMRGANALRFLNATVR